MTSRRDLLVRSAALAVLGPAACRDPSADWPPSVGVRDPVTEATRFLNGEPARCARGADWMRVVVPRIVTDGIGFAAYLLAVGDRVAGFLERDGVIHDVEVDTPVPRRTGFEDGTIWSVVPVTFALPGRVSVLEKTELLIGDRGELGRAQAPPELYAPEAADRPWATVAAIRQLVLPSVAGERVTWQLGPAKGEITTDDPLAEVGAALAARPLVDRLMALIRPTATLTAEAIRRPFAGDLSLVLATATGFPTSRDLDAIGLLPASAFDHAVANVAQQLPWVRIHGGGGARRVLCGGGREPSALLDVETVERVAQLVGGSELLARIVSPDQVYFVRADAHEMIAFVNRTAAARRTTDEPWPDLWLVRAGDGWRTN